MHILRKYYPNMMKQYNSLGFSYSYLEKNIISFIEYCESEYPDIATITPECALEWIYSKKSKTRKVLGDRIIAVKKFGEYLNSIGVESYVPNIYVGTDYHKPVSLLNDNQLGLFFKYCDSIEPNKRCKNREYVIPVIFRLIYGCGLRNSEATNIKMNDIDLDEGKIKIIHSKGDKDRIIYMDKSLVNLCNRFNEVQEVMFPNREYFFNISGKKLSKHNIDDYFDKILRESCLIEQFVIKPTVHGLRHLFAVNNLRKCLSLGEDMDVYIKYLSQYMGHESTKETMYYIHIFETLLPEYRERMEFLTKDIEVYYEEF